ncbi:hypothetical protein PYW07_013281 [Mythimna separata]|uniref:HTH psq-type domain-containing protein n=1 Tax=Mythimna separata TaxID=271217 RepID=A0AAD8DJE5_MYTSE|nr:hypothetical protein PYW07_013281 [Mythimna separata]
MTGRARKLAYQRHEYSGVRKSSKRVRNAFKRIHGVDDRVKIWRAEEHKKKLMNEQNTVPDDSIVTQNALPRTYSRAKPKVPNILSTSTVTAKPVVDVNCPQADPIPGPQQSGKSGNRRKSPLVSRVDREIEIIDLDTQSDGEQSDPVRILYSPFESPGPEQFGTNGNTSPQCDVAESTIEDQIKALIARVFHYLEQEFETIKNMDAATVLRHLARLPHRTARATGVSEATVLAIIEEEATRNKAERGAARRSGLSKKSRGLCKEQSLAENLTTAPESELLVMKTEPFEYYKEQAQVDPISLVEVRMKSEPSGEDQLNDTKESSTSKRKRKPKKSDCGDNCTCTQLHTSRNYPKETMESAVESVVNGTMSIKEASRHFGIYHSTLTGRVNKVLKKNTKKRSKNETKRSAVANIGPSTPTMANIGPSTPTMANIGPSTPTMANIGPSTPTMSNIGPSTPTMASGWLLQT